MVSINLGSSLTRFGNSVHQNHRNVDHRGLTMVVDRVFLDCNNLHDQTEMESFEIKMSIVGLTIAAVLRTNDCIRRRQ